MRYRGSVPAGGGRCPGGTLAPRSAETPPEPLPAPLTASPFPRSAAAIPPRPPRRVRGRERRWAPCAGVSPGPRCCRRWVAGWRRPPEPPSPRLPGWCSPSRRAARAAAMSPSPPGKGGTGSGEMMPRWHRERVTGQGTAGGDAPGFSTGGRTAAAGQSTRWVGDKPLCHRARCSSPGMSALITVCPCHSLNTPVPYCPRLTVPVPPIPVTPIPLFPTTLPCPHPPHSLLVPLLCPARATTGVTSVPPSPSASGPPVLLQGYFWAIPPVPCLSQPGSWGQQGAGTAQGHGSGVTCPPPCTDTWGQ